MFATGTIRNVWIKKPSLSSRFWSRSVATRVHVVSIPRLITRFWRVRKRNRPSRAIALRANRVHKINSVLSTWTLETNCPTAQRPTRPLMNFSTVLDEHYETADRSILRCTVHPYCRTRRVVRTIWNRSSVIIIRTHVTPRQFVRTIVFDTNITGIFLILLNFDKLNFFAMS